MKFKFFVVIFSILLIGAVVGYGQENQQPIKPPHANPEVPRMTAFEAMEFYKQGKLILANAHEAKTFAAGHIVGSINLPNFTVQKMNVKLPNNFIIAFYCS